MFPAMILAISTKSVYFSAVPVYFMTVTVGSPMDVSLKMNAKKSGFSPLLSVQYLVEVVYEAN